MTIGIHQPNRYAVVVRSNLRSTYARTRENVLNARSRVARVSVAPRSRTTMAARSLPRSLRLPLRKYASASSGPINPHSVGPFEVFDRKVKRMQKDRSALRDNGDRSRTVDYVREEVADRLVERFMVSAKPTHSFI